MCRLKFWRFFGEDGRLGWGTKVGEVGCGSVLVDFYEGSGQCLRKRFKMDDKNFMQISAAVLKLILASILNVNVPMLQMPDSPFKPFNTTSNENPKRRTHALPKETETRLQSLLAET